VGGKGRGVGVGRSENGVRRGGDKAKVILGEKMVLDGPEV